MPEPHLYWGKKTVTIHGRVEQDYLPGETKPQYAVARHRNGRVEYWEGHKWSDVIVYVTENPSAMEEFTGDEFVINFRKKTCPYKLFQDTNIPNVYLVET